jgi:hypothetical protein
LKRPIFEVCGAKRTFPVGKSTPPLKLFTEFTEILVNVKV